MVTNLVSNWCDCVPKDQKVDSQLHIRVHSVPDPVCEEATLFVATQTVFYYNPEVISRALMKTFML